MVSIFGKDVDEAADKLNKAKVKASEFEGKGLTLQFISVEKVKSQYGAEADSSIVEKNILEEGEQFLFQFKDADGLERKHYSTSMPFFIGMHQVEMNENDWLHIRREGVKDKTRYYVEIVPEVKGKISPRKEIQQEEEDLSGTSFDDSVPF